MELKIFDKEHRNKLILLIAITAIITIIITILIIVFPDIFIPDNNGGGS